MRELLKGIREYIMKKITIYIACFQCCDVNNNQNKRLHASEGTPNEVMYNIAFYGVTCFFQHAFHQIGALLKTFPQ